MVVDPVTETRLALVYPDIVTRWKSIREEFYDLHGLQMRVTDTFRSYGEQFQLFCEGRKRDATGKWVKVGRTVTDARGGESLHNFGLGLDIAFMGDDPYLEKNANFESLWKFYGELCQKNDMVWGGNWKIKDRPHCEKDYDLSLHALQEIFEKTGLAGVFERCDQIRDCGKELVC